MTTDAPLGHRLPDWQSPPPPPEDLMLEGRFVRLTRLLPAHGPELYKAYAGYDAVWTYLPDGPFDTETGYQAWMDGAVRSQDPLFFAVLNKEREAFEGTLSLLRINTRAGSIEVGYITYSPALQRTRAATEAIYLLIKWAFEAGYRRFEWKCNALNRPSRRAAERYGLSFEGVFRQHNVVKGRNRDTAWYAAIDTEWAALADAYETWLSPENFSASGRQVTRLSDLTAPILVQRDPLFERVVSPS